MLINPYLNDNLGDCVIAAKGHIGGMLVANAASAANQLILTDDQITKLYSAIGGYVPGDPSTDNGCDMQTALAYVQANGLIPGSANPHKIAGWLAVDATNREEVMTAINLFENIDIGMELPDAWVNNMPSGSGFTWDVAGAPDPSNGHNPMAGGYGPKGVYPDTWGMIGVLTWDALAMYAATSANGELYTVISQDILTKATQKAPNGFDWTQLTADFQALGGSLTV